MAAGKLVKGMGWAAAGHAPEEHRIWEQWRERGMCRDTRDISVVRKLQAASSKPMRASLGLSAAVSMLHGIS